MWRGGYPELVTGKNFNIDPMKPPGGLNLREACAKWFDQMGSFNVYFE
jgi:hypothetical protein